nr:hypothetical protein [Candidatus Saccharibacteria bacterium]
MFQSYTPKKLGKRCIASILERQVQKLRSQNECVVVAVAGSVGKTTTKLAIAQVLGYKLRVRYQEGNYNDRLTVPLVFFGHTAPSIWNIMAWAKIIAANSAIARRPFPYDVVVVELGTDGPGQMKCFEYIKPDITVLTAITPEHMLQFGTFDKVMREEASVFGYGGRVILNAAMVPKQAIEGQSYQTYSIVGLADTWATSSHSGLDGQLLQIHASPGIIKSHITYIGQQGAQSATAAVAVAAQLGFQMGDLEAALKGLRSFAGRMKVLPGIKGSTLIDDTYNATPVAVQAALDVLYGARASQRIAVLGSMNELGAYSQEAHEIVGAYCDSSRLDLVVTLGSDAERWIAPVARARGCRVASFLRYDECAAYVK